MTADQSLAKTEQKAHDEKGAAASSESLIAQCVRESLTRYLEALGGQEPANLHGLVMQEAEKAVVAAALDLAKGKKSLAASYLGMNRNTLRAKLRQYNLEASADK